MRERLASALTLSYTLKYLNAISGKKSFPFYTACACDMCMDMHVMCMCMYAPVLVASINKKEIPEKLLCGRPLESDVVVPGELSAAY